jgi:hypothetical protein
MKHKGYGLIPISSQECSPGSSAAQSSEPSLPVIRMQRMIDD